MEQLPRISPRERAIRILAQVPLIDGHNDWPWNLREWFGESLSRPSLELDSLPIGQTDLNRLQAGAVGGQFWSAFVPCQSSDKESLFPLLQTLQQIDLIYRMVDQEAKQFGFASNSTDVWKIFKSGRIACLIGVEGLHQIGNSFSVLRTFRRLGVRYITLTHNCNNTFADSATSSTPLHRGLSDKGRLAVQEMNRVGLMIDLSHTSEQVQEQVIDISVAPVIFSHSSCLSLTAHPRNVSDKVLDMLKENGGIIMICFLDAHVKPQGKDAATTSDVINHIVYVGERIGYEHVGIGSDFDGMLRGPEGLDEVSHYPQLVEMLLDKGIGEEEVKGIIGLNILRVMDEVDALSMSLQVHESSAMVLDNIESTWTTQIREMLIQEGERRRERAL